MSAMRRWPQNMAREIEEMDRMIGLFLHYVRANYNETPQRVVPDEVVREAPPPRSANRFELRGK